MKVQLSDILLAQRMLSGVVVRTPLMYSEPLSRYSGASVWVKGENWQTTGSFKLRGAYYKMAQLSLEERERGVITASAGNHGLAVAWAGRLLGVSVVVVAPRGTPKTKLEGIAQYGAEVIAQGGYYDEAETVAQEMALATKRVYVHAFEDAAVVAGQGTVGLEMLLDQPDLDAIVVPAGGGGLICGIGVAAKAINPAVEVVGVQSEASPAWHAAWSAGKMVDVEYQPTWGEGLLGGIGEENFTLARQVVDRFELVTEEQMKAAMRWALETHHWVVEGSGAVGLAYLLYHGGEMRGRRVGVVITGGNLDVSRLRELIAVAE